MPWNSKKYARINWKNRPSTATALGATNLNKMDQMLNDVDNQLVEFDTSKLNVSVANGLIKTLTIDAKTGKIKATELGGTTHEWDLNLEKIPAKLELSEAGILTMTTDDGQKFTVNVAELIKAYEFTDSATIDFTKTGQGPWNVTAIVKEGTIEGKHLKPDYRADIQSYMNTAQTAASDALQYSKDARRYSEGDPSYPGSEIDNAKFYYEQSKKANEEAKESEMNAASSAAASAGSAASAQQALEQTEQAGENALEQLNDALALNLPQWEINFTTGHLEYQGGRFNWQIENSNGHLMWEVLA